MTRSFDPPRLLLDVDGRAVCAQVRGPEHAGAGRPPVVLAAGGPGQGTEGAWGPQLEELLAREHPVLTYDRAGSGRSDGPQHGTVAGMAEELDRVVHAAGLRPPLIVVGWSLGGFVAQGYALRYPDHVAGLVFVDPTPTEAPPRAARFQVALMRPLLRGLELAARAGLLGGPRGERLARGLAGPGASAQTEELALRLYRDPSALHALRVTTARVPRHAAEVADTLRTHALPDVPAAVVTAARRDGVPAEYVENIRHSHERLAARFPGGRAITAERATHQVPVDDPELVAAVVAEVAATGR